MANQKAVILTIVLIFVIIIAVIAAIALLLMTNQARITEAQIKRIRAFYTAQAAVLHTIQELRKGNPLPTSETLNNLTANINVEASGSGPYTTRRIRASVNY